MAAGAKIELHCACGARLKAAAAAAGKSVRCPKCAAVITIRAGNPLGITSAGAQHGQPDSSGVITHACTCGARWKMPASAAGRRARCKKCDQVFIVRRNDSRSAEAGADALDELQHGAPTPRPAPEEDVFQLEAPVAPPRAYRSLEHSTSGPKPRCPSCRKEFAHGAKVCTDCGVFIKDGRKILMIDEENLDRAYVAAENTIRVISFISPAGIYPIASEAFGAFKPWSIRAIAVLTICTSLIGILAPWFGAEADTAVARLMLWTGDFDAYLANLGSNPSGAPPSLRELLGALQREALQGHGFTFQWYQLITHLFLHEGFFHLAGNLLFLMVFGSRVNALIGQIWTLALYPLLGVVAALAQMLSSLDQAPYPMLGASGAIMGLAGMYLMYFPIHNVHMAAWWRWGFIGGFRLHLKLWPVRGFWVVLFYIAFDLLYVSLGDTEGVAHWAHLGGFIGGMIIALVLLCTRRVSAGGADLITTLFGRSAWPLVGHPSGRWPAAEDAERSDV
jgi:membrane associated rhomboid family serine protease